MTPDKAIDLLHGTTPGPWEWREGKDQNGEFVALSGPDGADALRTWDGDLYASGVHGTDADKALAAAAPTLAALAADMRAEYQVQRQFAGEWYPCQLGLGVTWTGDQAVADEYADTCRTRSIPVRIVRRHITKPEEV